MIQGWYDSFQVWRKILTERFQTGKKFFNIDFQEWLVVALPSVLASRFWLCRRHGHECDDVTWQGGRATTYLLVRLLQVFHKHSHDHVDQNELGHEDENDEEEGGEVRGDAAVAEAVVAVLALLPQGVFHDPVPVISGRDTEQGQESHSEWPEVCVLAEALARVVLVAFWKKAIAVLITLLTN